MREHTHHFRKNWKRAISFLAGGCVLWVFTLVPSARAESMASLALQSDAIVITVPQERVSYWDGNIIRTRVTLAIQQIVAGNLEDKTVTVVYDGGVVGKIGLKVSHGVRLPKGQKALLFLKAKGGHYSVVNQRGGIFFIVPGRAGEIAIPATAVHLPPPGLTVKSSRISAWEGDGIPLRKLITDIKGFKQ